MKLSKARQIAAQAATVADVMDFGVTYKLLHDGTL